MKKFLDSRKSKILIALLAVLLGFMIAAVYSGGTGSFFSNAISIVTVPIQRVSSSISSSVSQWFQTHTDAKGLFEENQRLQKEVQELRKNLTDYEEIKHENKQYYSVIETTKGRDDWQLSPASVIARDSQNRFYSFTIDKGTRHEVSYLDPIISADGLVGYVSEVGYNYAKVLTILDVKVDVGAYDSGEREIGVVSGTVELAEGGLCAMDYLPRDTKIKEGSTVLTSGSLTGGGSIFPRDVIIGKVVRMEPDAHGTNTHAIIQPTTDIMNVKDVFVITNFDGKETTIEEK